MTGKQLYDQLQAFGGLSITEATVKSWINTGQLEASLEIPVATTLSLLNVVAGTEVSTPLGVMSIISAVCEDGDYPTTSIQVKSASLVFDDAADFITVVYNSTAPEYTDINSQLTIHPSLHGPMLYFLISMYYDTEGEGDSEESGLAQRYYERWLYYRGLALSSLADSQSLTNLRNPILTEDVLPKSPRRKLAEDVIYE